MPPRLKIKGYSLVFDVVRRFAQPLGIDLPQWEKPNHRDLKGSGPAIGPYPNGPGNFLAMTGASAFADWTEKGARQVRQQVLFEEFKR
jgi:hypothetical protein